MVFMNGLNSNFTFQLADYRTTLFRNFNLSNSVQHVNTNTRGKWTHIPPVFPQNYKWTTKEVSIKCQTFLQIIFEEFWKLQEPRNIPTNISKSFPCTFFHISSWALAYTVCTGTRACAPFSNSVIVLVQIFMFPHLTIITQFCRTGRN